MIRVVRHLLLLAVLGAFALPASAQADPVSDCNNDGKLDQSYTNEQLKRALDNIPSDVDEYTNCRELIGAAITSGSDKGENRPGSGASASSNGADNGGVSPAEQEARTKDNAELEAITSDGNESAPSVRLDGEEVEPGSNGLFDLASASNDVPVPLLVALIAIGLLVILGGLVVLRERVPALARIPLLSKIPRVSFPRFRR